MSFAKSKYAIWVGLYAGLMGCRTQRSLDADLTASADVPVSSHGLITDIGPGLIQGETRKGKSVEVTLTVQETVIDYGKGKKVTALTYNGTIPGPTIVADVGDELIIHVKNRAKVPTILHPHGFILPQEADGTHISQDPIPPGGDYTHRFKLRHPATYWYHSHYNSTNQIGRGLYGAIVVRGPHEPKLPERLLVIGQVTPEGEAPHPFNILEPHAFLVNGKPMQTTKIRPGEKQRYRIINATPQAVLNLRLSNGDDMTLIGTDGGLTERPYAIKKLRLDAGERAEVVITAPANAQGSIEIIADPVPFMPRKNEVPADDPAASFLVTLPPIYEPARPLNIVRLRVEGEPMNAPELPQSLVSIPTDFEVAATREFSVGFNVFLVKDDNFPLLFKFPVNGELYPKTPQPREKLGTWVVHKWTNKSPSPHPIHVHGFRFIVLKRNGVEEPIKGWKDTADLPAYGTLEYAIHLDGYPGEWLYHCHFESHMETGFLGSMIVDDAKTPGAIKPSTRTHHHHH